MAGAFVAVADDATATWWNPAGLPGTLIADGVVSWQSNELLDPDDRPVGESVGRRATATGFAFSFPAAGVGYQRIRLADAGPAAIAGGAAGRQDQRLAPTARSLLSHQVGLTVAQSLGDAVVVGATARLLRGEVSALAPAAGLPDAVLDTVAEGEGAASVRGDVDAGVLIRAGRVRFGLAGRNLTGPRFRGPQGIEWRLERRVRAGVALVAEAERAGRQRWVVAFDADLTRERGLAGDRRAVALGAEHWLWQRRLGLRGGLSASTVGEARPALSGGVSLGVRSGFAIALDASGGAAAGRGWGLAAHMTF